MASAIGVIFSNMHEENIPELVRRRTMASVPFGGRYRLIDFQLSNLVNSGITTVGVMTNNNYRSLIDHLGSGKDWDLARKDGGLILLPPYSDEDEKMYSTRLEALCGLTGFLSRRMEEYVVLCDCDGVAKFDIADIIAYHEAKNADITLVSHFGKVEESTSSFILDADGDGKITNAQFATKAMKNKEENLYVNVMVLKRQFLLSLVDDAVTPGYSSFAKDIIIKQLNSLKMYRYDFKGYYAGITSMKAYYKHSMSLLNKDARDQLFSGRDVYTKVRDSAPSKYGKDAVVSNSLVSDGCEIEGVVENSILFRGVKVEKGAVVRNSIVMQDSIISTNAALDCVITDKNVVVSPKRKLSGCDELPFFIQKGTML